MSNFEQFMKRNKIKVENIKYPATASLRDEKGNPLMWELRNVTTKERNRLVEECTKYIGLENGETEQKLDNEKFLCKLAAAAVVYPNLRDKELQDSYGVLTPEDLVLEMLDDYDEFDKLIRTIKNHCKVDVAKEVETVKN